MPDKLKLIAFALLVLSALLVLIWIDASSTTRSVPVGSQPATATKDPLEIYDPKLCKQGEPNKIYISLGRYVFPMAYAKRQAVVYDPLLEHNADLALKVPDPTEQRGCFGNPLQSTSHAFFSPFILAKGDELSAVRSALRLITLYRLDRGKTSQDADNIWPGESSELEIGQTTCRAATLREELLNGMSACRIKPNDAPDARQEDWAATYTARLDIYATPMNRPFVVNCNSGLYSTSIGQCDVAYEVMHDLGISYGLDPYPLPSRSSYPIDHIIDIDKSIRDVIARSVIKDYPWPDQADDSR